MNAIVPCTQIVIERRFPKRNGEPRQAADKVMAHQSSPDPVPKVQSLFERFKQWLFEGCKAWTDCGPMAGTTPEIHEYTMRDLVMAALFSGPSPESVAIAGNQ